LSKIKWHLFYQNTVYLLQGYLNCNKITVAIKWNKTLRLLQQLGLLYFIAHENTSLFTHSHIHLLIINRQMAAQWKRNIKITKIKPLENHSPFKGKVVVTKRWAKSWSRCTGRYFKLPLLFARPAVTFPAKTRHRPLITSKLYCLVTKSHRC